MVFLSLFTLLLIKIIFTFYPQRRKKSIQRIYVSYVSSSYSIYSRV
jgi:hypothetical protein